MKLVSKDIIPRSREEVYNVLKNDLEKLVPYMPNVSKIEMVDRKEKGGGLTAITNHWYANAEIPTIAKKFIKEELMSWKDKALWHDSEFYVEYELESFWGNDIYDATGKNVMKELGPDKTELTLTCDLVIHPSKVPGIPKFLVKKVLPAIEGLIEKILQPNLTSLGKGLISYFNAQKK
ncbi:SRPBCC family protein [Bacteriovoracales bacterium]|nr:SRPBCC family protein [Bacteriovoracales bacterium]